MSTPRCLPRLLTALLIAGAHSELSAQDNPASVVPDMPAELIVHNAQIRSSEGWHEAMAISGGYIVALGDVVQLEKHRSDQTRDLDLDGATVLPGFHDMHVHPILAGFAHQACAIDPAGKLEALQAGLAKCVAEHNEGEWITGRAYERGALGVSPEISMLDQVSPDNPVIIDDITGHTAWANSMALDMAGINSETPDPESGIIERDEDGNPTGVLHEAAMWQVKGLIPEPDRQAYTDALEWGLDRMLEQGITSFVDASTSEAQAQAYADVADAGGLKQRVRGCLWSLDGGVIQRRGFYTRNRFRPDCVKIFLDGVPTDSHTAAMLEPYFEDGEPGEDKGMLIMPEDMLSTYIPLYDSMGLTVKFHAAGDAAVRQGIDAIALARKLNGFSGNLHNPGHSTFVHPDDIQRARELGITLEFSPYIFSPSPVADDIGKAIGEVRMQRINPLGDAIRAGILTVVGSDWPVVPSANPWIAMETMVTRQVPGGSEKSLAIGQAITLEQAFRALTQAGATQMKNAHLTGSLDLGKAADFIVIDRNVFEIPVTEIHQTQVIHVFIEGEQVVASGKVL